MNRDHNIDCTLLTKDNLLILIPEKEYIVCFNTDVSFFMGISDISITNSYYYQSKMGTLILTNLRLVYISNLQFSNEEFKKEKDIKKFKNFQVPLNRVYSNNINQLTCKLNNGEITFIIFDFKGGGSSFFVSLLSYHLKSFDLHIQCKDVTNEELIDIYNKYL